MDSTCVLCKVSLDLAPRPGGPGLTSLRHPSGESLSRYAKTMRCAAIRKQTEKLLPRPGSNPTFLRVAST